MDPRLYILGGTLLLLVIALVATLVSTVRALRRRRAIPAGPLAIPQEWPALPPAPKDVDTSLEGLTVDVSPDSPSAALLTPLRKGAWQPPESPAPASNLPEVSLAERIANYQPAPGVPEPAFSVPANEPWKVAGETPAESSRTATPAAGAPVTAVATGSAVAHGETVASESDRASRLPEIVPEVQREAPPAQPIEAPVHVEATPTPSVASPSGNTTPPAVAPPAVSVPRAVPVVPPARNTGAPPVWAQLAPEVPGAAAPASSAPLIVSAPMAPAPSAPPVEPEVPASAIAPAQSTPAAPTAPAPSAEVRNVPAPSVPAVPVEEIDEISALIPPLEPEYVIPPMAPSLPESAPASPGPAAPEVVIERPVSAVAEEQSRVEPGPPTRERSAPTSEPTLVPPAVGHANPIPPSSPPGWQTPQVVSAPTPPPPPSAAALLPEPTPPTGPRDAAAGPAPESVAPIPQPQAAAPTRLPPPPAAAAPSPAPTLPPVAAASGVPEILAIPVAVPVQLPPPSQAHTDEVPVPVVSEWVPPAAAPATAPVPAAVPASEVTPAPVPAPAVTPVPAPAPAVAPIPVPTVAPEVAPAAEPEPAVAPPAVTASVPLSDGEGAAPLKDDAFWQSVFREQQELATVLPSQGANSPVPVQTPVPPAAQTPAPAPPAPTRPATVVNAAPAVPQTPSPGLQPEPRPRRQRPRTVVRGVPLEERAGSIEAAGTVSGAMARASRSESSEVTDIVLAAPVEMWFGEARIGVKAGTKTYEQFRKYADVLMADLQASKGRSR